MGEKRSTIYSSSNEALVKFFVLMITIGISIMASFIDYKSCYITILVQACNNMYDFYKFTDNRIYAKLVKRWSIAVIFFAIVAIILSIVGILDLYPIMKLFGIRLIGIACVTLPMLVIYGDYILNVHYENIGEMSNEN